MLSRNLNLDFSLSLQKDRVAYLNQIIGQNTYSFDNLELMANYILWGKDEETGLNWRQEGNELATRNKTWDSPHAAQSLDELTETPGFNEANALPFNAPYISKSKTYTIDRVIERKRAPENQLNELEALWARIDELDLKIELWELNNGKRTKEIRESLINKFTQKELIRAREQALKWTQQQWLQQRHKLVELRREQFPIRDSYVNPIQRHTFAQSDAGQLINDDHWIQVDVQVGPVGLKQNDSLSELLFQPLDLLSPEHFNEEDLKLISKAYWAIQDKKQTDDKWLDFCNKDQVYTMATNLELMRTAANDGGEAWIDAMPALWETFQFYVGEARLNESQRFILEEKFKGKINVDIARDVNQRFNKHYTTNYISTIYTQQIMPAIAATAQEHQKRIEELFFPENWKKCTKCGRLLIRDGDNFMKKAQSKDGFATRCKRCEKEIRNEK